MHELSLVSAAIAQAVDAAQRAGVSRIRRLTFGLPSDGHVTEDSIELLVAALGRGTAVEGAAVAFEAHPDDGELTLLSIDVDGEEDEEPTPRALQH